jgi:predicted RNase H-like nuclease
MAALEDRLTSSVMALLAQVGAKAWATVMPN